MGTTDAGRILVVEDDEIIREVFVLALQEEGYDVCEARNGRQALAILESWRPDLIILDVMMPEMDGFAFCERQRERGLAPEAPLFVLSASARAIERFRDLGAVECVAKPFDLEYVLARIDEVLSPPRWAMAR